MAKKFVDWENLTEIQKIHATEQYVELEAHQDECSIEEATKILIGQKVPYLKIGENKELQEHTKGHRFEIDTEDELYIFVDL